MTTGPITSRGAIGWLAALLAGAFSAGIFLVSASFFAAGSVLFMFAYISITPLLLVGLGAGSLCALIASVLAAGIVLATTKYAAACFVFCLIVALPALLIVKFALRFKQTEDGQVFWYPEGYLFTALVVYCICCFGAVAVASIINHTDLMSLTSVELSKAFEPMRAQLSAQEIPALYSGVNAISAITPILSVIFWVIIIFACTLLAQMTLKQQNWLLRSPLSLSNFQIPAYILPALIIAGLCGLLLPHPFNYFGLNIVLMLCIPLSIAGIQLAHNFCANYKVKAKPVKFFGLFFLYFSIFVMPKMYVLAILSIVGVLDMGMDLPRSAPRASSGSKINQPNS